MGCPDKGASGSHHGASPRFRSEPITPVSSRYPGPLGLAVLHFPSSATHASAEAAQEGRCRALVRRREKVFVRESGDWGVRISEPGGSHHGASDPVSYQADNRRFRPKARPFGSPAIAARILVAEVVSRLHAGSVPTPEGSLRLERRVRPPPSPQAFLPSESPFLSPPALPESDPPPACPCFASARKVARRPRSATPPKPKNPPPAKALPRQFSGTIPSGRKRFSSHGCGDWGVQRSSPPARIMGRTPVSMPSP